MDKATAVMLDKLTRVIDNYVALVALATTGQRPTECETASRNLRNVAKEAVKEYVDKHGKYKRGE